MTVISTKFPSRSPMFFSSSANLEPRSWVPMKVPLRLCVLIGPSQTSSALQNDYDQVYVQHCMKLTHQVRKTPPVHGCVVNLVR